MKRFNQARVNGGSNYDSLKLLLERDRRGEKPKPPSAWQPVALTTAWCDTTWMRENPTQPSLSYSPCQRGTARRGSRLIADSGRNNERRGTIRRRERRHRAHASGLSVSTTGKAWVVRCCGALLKVQSKPHSNVAQS